MSKRTFLTAAIGLALAALTAAAIVQERREVRLPASGEPIVFRKVESEPDRAIVRNIVARAQYDFQVRDLLPALERGELRLADIDINRDGTPEYWVMHAHEAGCAEQACDARLFWLVEAQWTSPAHYGLREGIAWGVKRPGYRDYVVYTGERREVFPFPEGRIVVGRPLRSEEERTVALDCIRRHIAGQNNPDETPDFWRTKIDEGRVQLIEADLNDDGQVEWIIVVEVPGYCGTIGCDSLLLRKYGRTWRPTTSLSTMPQFLLLDDKKFGWHRIYTGEEIYTFRADGGYFDSIEIDNPESGRAR